MSKSELYPLIADLRSLGYSASDIARALHRTPQRISQILRDMGMGPKRLVVQELPHDIRQRIEHLQNESEMIGVSPH